MDYKVLLGDTPQLLRDTPDNSVELVVTSPPYPGVPALWGEFFAPENFDTAHAWLDGIWDECIRVLKPGCKLAINIANTGRNPYLDNSSRLWQWGWRNKEWVSHSGVIIWDKSYGQADTAWGSWRNPSDAVLTDDSEFIQVFRKRGKRLSPTTEPIIEKDDFLNWRHSIWRVKAESAKRTGHIAPFPIELPRRLITLYTFPGETVLDPFSGKGTTGQACAMLGRNFIGFDHNPEYVELSLKNIHNTQADLGQVDRQLTPEISQARIFSFS